MRSSRFYHQPLLLRHVFSHAKPFNFPEFCKITETACYRMVEWRISSNCMKPPSRMTLMCHADARTLAQPPPLDPQRQLVSPRCFLRWRTRYNFPRWTMPRPWDWKPGKSGETAERSRATRARRCDAASHAAGVKSLRRCMAAELLTTAFPLTFCIYYFRNDFVLTENCRLNASDSSAACI